jgi:hypothetical protein
LDQPRQCYAHRVIKIGIGEAAVQLQARYNPLKEDAALLNRHAIGGGPDGPKLLILDRGMRHGPADAIDVNRYCVLPTFGGPEKESDALRVLMYAHAGDV